jgi:mannose-1-phosphate guanylyltransferase/mannose-6-phosphate isomerase
MPLKEIVPVVLCGGAGKRLRPLSRPSCPKPFLKLGSRYSMLQETLLRIQGCARPILVMNALLRDRAEQNLKGINCTPRHVILEPWGRNTASALAAAASLLEDDLMLVLPSDHWIGNPEALMQAVLKAADFARQGSIVSFGIRPSRIETGFGYISRGPVIVDGVHRIDRFVEKPPRDIARTLVRSGTYDWNSGIFLLSAKTARDELTCFEPGLMAAAKKSVVNATHDGPWCLLSEDFSQCPSRSIDVALMERSDKTLVVPVDLEWSDLGTWPSVIHKIRTHKSQTAKESAALRPQVAGFRGQIF